MVVNMRDNGLQVGDKYLPVYAGAVQYWRLERALWPLILDQVKELGFDMIETYLPWGIHEPVQGHFDWGQEDPRKDVEAFLRLCEEKNIWVIARPGPLINAELTDFGFPEWVLLDPAVQARTANGTIHLDAAWGLHPPHQFPVPSYASEAFYKATAGWFDAICPLIARHLAPAGCIVTVQSDNETCYLFHDQSYATDYSNDSLALYRSFLTTRYSDIAALNALYGTNYKEFAAVEPPRDCTVTERRDVPWHVDWIEYKEYQIRWCVARIARMLRERGITKVPIFHDVAFQHSTPLDISALEADPDIDWVGMNLYSNKEGYHGATRKIRYLSGATRLSFVPEFGCGLWSHHPLTPTPDEEEFITLSALMCGLKAFSFYMLVERDRWQGSPITRHGTFRPEYASFYKRLMNFLHTYELWNFERQRQTLVLFNYDLGRYIALTQTLNYSHADLYGLPPALFRVDVDLDMRWNPETEGSESLRDNWLGTVIQQLKKTTVDYDLADTHIDPTRLDRYSVVCLPATDFLNGRDQEHLVEYVRKGGNLVFGPGLPYLNPAMQSCEVLARYIKEPGTVELGKGSLTWVAQKEKLPEELAKLTAPVEYKCDNAEYDLIIQKNGERTLLFLANPTDRAGAAYIRFLGKRTLQAAWLMEREKEGQTLQGEGSISLDLPAYSVQIWEVTK